MSKVTDKIKNDVREHGMHIIGVMGDASGPPFSYSIGLYANYKHPEIIICGMDQQTAHTVINCCIGDLIKEGKVFSDGQTSSELLQGYDCAFREVSVVHYQEYLGQAQWFYQGNAFPCLQCFWPDEQGKFPWDEDADSDCKELQPLLFNPCKP